MTYKNLNPGDVVRFKYRDTEKTAAVLPMLTFNSHVVVRFTSCGHVVNDRNFVCRVRRGRRS